MPSHYDKLRSSHQGTLIIEDPEELARLRGYSTTEMFKDMLRIIGEGAKERYEGEKRTFSSQENFLKALKGFDI
ncbi:hypothetical protein LCGC14_2553510 [marine sediment metagenome]|uniref:Uncharacterized protein n=1 Tax=marine sediment metagenome TaxID=412755 RepID=A0A0F9CYC5_9ZZZZ